MSKRQHANNLVCCPLLSLNPSAQATNKLKYTIRPHGANSFFTPANQKSIAVTDNAGNTPPFCPAIIGSAAVLIRSGAFQ